MERVEIPISGEAERWVEAAERGDEVVLTRDGKVVAEIKPTAASQAGRYDPEAIRRLQAAVPATLQGHGVKMIREQRDSYRY